MGFGEAIQTCLKKFGKFSGRASRSEFWWFYLFVTLLAVAATIVDVLVLGTNFGERGVVRRVASFATLVPTLAATSRRLHDTNRRGWWMLLPLLALVPLFLFLLPVGLERRYFTNLIAVLAGFFTIGLLLYWLIKRGTQGANRFGPDPLGTAADVEGVF